jgi:catechol 2,3-dioxygenase-like lactoylglutathione lyase family enzyme
LDYRHVAIVVSDLRAAEDFYRETLGMDVLGRESWGEDGLSYALRPDKGWDDAEAAGVDLQLAALRRDEVVLALFSGDAQPGQVFALGLVMDASGIANVRARLEDGGVIADEPEFLEFFDPFGIRWQISTNREFLHAGQIADRWLDI